MYETEKVTTAQRVKKEEFYIAADGGGLERVTAEYISRYLEEMGYASHLGKIGEIDGSEGYSAVIAVGREAMDTASGLSGVEKICCVPDSYVEREGTVSPCLSSGSLARAAVLLFSHAESFTVLSQKEGAADVQDACDYLDTCGVSYTVCSLDGAVYGDAVLSAVKQGCDVLIVPFGDISPMKGELKKYGTAVVAVGEGEPVSGAVATFCIDTERLSRYMADLAVSRVTGREEEPCEESFYKVCIDMDGAEEHDVDIEALREDFCVAMVS